MNLPCGAWGLPWWLSWCKKKSTCNPGDLGSIPGLGRSPGEGNSYPLQYSGPENFTDRGAWGCKELDMTERLSLNKNVLVVVSG